MLRERGYRHAHALRGGYDAWQQASLPAEPKQRLASAEVAGPCPVCQAVHA
jgi:hypothetical protein